MTAEHEQSPTSPSEGLEKTPVEKGQIRLEGHFCGVATTASHRLEIAIPLHEEVDINLLYPLLAGLQASFKKRHTESNEEESPENKLNLWEELSTLLEIDRVSAKDENEEVVEDLLQSLGPGWQETFERCASRRSSKGESAISSEDGLKAALRDEERQLRATKAQERAMEIDIEAKEALVQNLMEERKALRAKTQELTKQLEQGFAERWLCGCLQGVSSFFQRKQGDVLETIVEALEEKEEEQARKEPSLLEIPDGQIFLDGHFAGRMVTKKHCLEIAMPVGATLPSPPLLELLRAMSDANGTQEADVYQKRAEVVSSVLGLVQADMDPTLQERAEGEEEDEDKSGATFTPPGERETEVVTKDYEEMSKELETLRGESSRLQKVQQEAEELRVKNAALVNFLSSAERSAAKLRAALTEAGIHPISSPECSPKALRQANQSPPDLQADIKELESWASRLRGIR